MPPRNKTTVILGHHSNKHNETAVATVDRRRVTRSETITARILRLSTNRLRSTAAHQSSCALCAFEKNIYIDKTLCGITADIFNGIEYKLL